MKSYEDIAKSVLKKSEERMAEKKRGGIIFGKKAAIASGLCAACLCGIGFWKLDSIRNSMDKQKIPQIVEIQPTTTAAVTSAVPSATTTTAVITDNSQTTQITVTTASSQTEITSTVSVQTANTSARTTTASLQTQTTTAKSTTTKAHTMEKITTTRTHTTTRKQTTTAKPVTTPKYTATTLNPTTTITHTECTTLPPVCTTTTIYYTHTTPSDETPIGSETAPSSYIGNVTKTTVNQNFKRIYVSGISDSVYSLTSESFDITDEFYNDIYIQSADSFNSYGYYFTYASVKGYYYNSEYIALLYDGCNELFYYKRED